MASFTEENYLKIIFHLQEEDKSTMVSTNALAAATQTKAASVSDMLKKLADKNYIDYIKYQGVLLTLSGKKLALQTIRKHRLWEVFLVEKLGFEWNEIHEIAEELEHIDSEKLTEKLDVFLGKPKFDPHGDPIPDAEGNMTIVKDELLSEAEIGKTYKVTSVKEDGAAFLKHLDKINIKLGTIITINEINEFDKSIHALIEHSKLLFLTKEVCAQLMVREV